MIEWAPGASDGAVNAARPEPVSPRDETLARAARAVGLDPASLFRLAGRRYDAAALAADPPAASSPAWRAAVDARLDALEREVRHLSDEAKRRKGGPR